MVKLTGETSADLKFLAKVLRFHEILYLTFDAFVVLVDGETSCF